MNRNIPQSDLHSKAARQVAVSIVIVNWHSADYLRSCLQSIYYKIKEVEFEVVVIDNASFDGSAEMVRSEFPDAKFIQNKRNVGYSKANNAAVQQTIGETLLFLNPDTEIIESPIGTLTDHLSNNPKIGAIGCRVLNPNLTMQRHYLQAFPNLVNQLLDIDLLKRAFPRWKLWGTRALYDYTGTPLDVEAISGSCLVVRRAVFERIRGFTESYFMYGEDLDLSYKIRRAGYGVQYCGEGKVIHYCGRSSERHDQRNFEAM